MNEKRPGRHGQLVGEVLMEVLENGGRLGFDQDGGESWTRVLSRFRRAALLGEVRASQKQDRRKPEGDEEGPSLD